MKPNKQNQRRKDILFILGSSFVVVVAWIGFNLYHIYVTSTISEDIQVQLTPIDPTFDTAIIQNLKSREQVNPAFERTATASQSAPTQLPQPTITDTATSPASLLVPTDTPITIQGQ